MAISSRTPRLLSLFFHLLSIASAVQIFGGTYTLSGQNDRCGNFQEFSCVNDQCDPYAGPFNQGECRNGAAPGKPCAPNAYCDTPMEGRCLETTVSLPGNHSTPGPGQGTPKHFFCVSVTSYYTPVIIWENDDCTGQSCFIPDNGEFVTWSRGQLANCAQIDPQTAVSTLPCIAAGQSGIFPPQGGFPSNVPVTVGGSAGLPVAFDNSHTCDVPHELPPSIPVDTAGPPATSDDPSTEYSSGITDTDGIDQLYKRSDYSVSVRQVPNNGIITTGALRNAFDYAGKFKSIPQLWTWVNQEGDLVRYFGNYIADLGWVVDHVVELDMIITFLIGRGNAIAQGLTQNQWNTLGDFIRSQGRQAVGGAVCLAYQQFASYIGDGGNIRGIDGRVNLLKNKVIASLIPSQAYPTRRGEPKWAISWSRQEAQATLDYMRLTLDQARDAAHDIGLWLDGIIQTGPQGFVAAAFVSWTQGVWVSAIAKLQTAVSQQAPYFKNDPT